MKKVLVVDDEPSIRELLKVFLEKKGFSVSLAEKAQEVRDFLKREKIDLVILDYSAFSQEIEGLIKEVKSLNKDTKVFILSGFSRQILEEDLGLPVELIDGFLSKAESIDKILEKVIQAL